MLIVIFLFLLVISILVIKALKYSCIEDKKFKLSKWKNEIYLKYGESTLEICPYDIGDKDGFVFVFDELKKIIINQTVYDYSDILDFSVNGQMSYKTSTSSGSMVGRGILGGVLFGGVGALAGASTASSTTTSEVDSYTITINLRNMQHPIEEYETYSSEIVNQVSGILKIIIDSNQN